MIFRIAVLAPGTAITFDGKGCMLFTAEYLVPSAVAFAVAAVLVGIRIVIDLAPKPSRRPAEKNVAATEQGATEASGPGVKSRGPQTLRLRITD